MSTLENLSKVQPRVNDLMESYYSAEDVNREDKELLRMIAERILDDLEGQDDDSENELDYKDK